VSKKSIFQAVFLVVAAISWFIYDYVALPEYSIHSFRSWIMAAALLAIIVLFLGLFGATKKAASASFIAFALVALLALVLSVGDRAWWPGNDKRLASLMPVAERRLADFSDDFAKTAAGSGFLLPSIDEERAAKIAQGKAAELKGKGNYYPATDEAAILHARQGERDRLVYVAPLEYADGTTALMRAAAGTPGYVEVDLEDGQARIVEVEGGMSYSPGAILARDLMRRVRAKFRTALLGEAHFEIDDSGKPWWIVEVLRRRAGLFGGTDAAGIVLVNAVTGSAERYPLGSQPGWIDRTVSFALALREAKDALRLKNGWANQKFKGKKEVLKLSEGYGYEIYAAPSGTAAFLSVGVIDPKSAEGGLAGIMLIDLRAKEAARYEMKGVEELRAMDIAGQDERARGQGLAADWPMLDCVAGKPAYFLILKNSTATKYAYVDAAEGLKVAVSDSADAARAMMAGLSGGEKPPVSATEIAPTVGAPDSLDEVLGGSAAGNDASGSDGPGGAAVADPGSAIAIATARVVVLRVKERGGQVQFIAQGDVDTLYAAPESLNNGVRFLKAGDTVELSYRGKGKERFVVELKNLSLER
jgi:hypothetical protein